MKTFGAIGALVIALALFAVPVYAQNPTLDGYTGPGGQVQDQVGGGGPGGQDQGGGGGEAVRGETEEGGDGEAVPTAGVTAGDGDGGALPFTGLDLALLAAAGTVLLGLGFGMRRLTRVRGQQA